MKATLDRRDLDAAAGFVARMSPKRPTVPILAGVLITAEAEELRLMVYDYEIAAETRIDASVIEASTVLVHANSLMQIVSKLPQLPVSLEVQGESLRIRCGQVRASLPLMSVGEYPDPKFAGEVVARIPGRAFEDAVTRVSPAAGRNDVVKVVEGVHIVVDGGGVAFSTTDRFRVAHMPVPCETSGSADVVVDVPVLVEAAKSFGSSDIVELGITEAGALTIRGERGVLCALPIEGKFPPVERLFPDSPLSTARIERDVLVEASQRAALPIEPKAAVEFTFGDGECTVVGKSLEDATGVSESFDIDLDGDEVVVKLRPQFVVDGVNACRADLVELWFTPGQRPGKPGPVMFTAASAASTFRYLLQPNLLLN